MVDPSSTFNDDAKNFDMIVKIQHFPGYKESLGPQDMDQLGEQIRMALQRCAVAESQISAEERRINDNLMSGITCMANYLERRADASSITSSSSSNSNNGDGGNAGGGDGRDGAFYILFQKTVITSSNTQCLFRMCDPAIRTGYIRQQALMILSLFSDLSSSCWCLKVPGDDENTDVDQQKPSVVSYARRQIAVMADALIHKGLLTSSSPDCIKALLSALFNGLMRPIGSESPKEILELVNKYHWPTILQDHDVNLIQDEETKIYYDYVIFILLHAWACRVLAKDPNSDMAKTFLREQLGSCTKFLQTCLRRIIHEGLQMGREIENLGVVVHNFMNCLVPVPIDRETNALVRRARNAFEQVLLHNKTSDDLFLMENVTLGTYNLKGQTIQTLIYNMEVWQLAHYISDEKRWECFHDNFLLRGNTLADDRRLIKNARKRCKNKFKLVAGLQGGEMCANCFVLEKTLLEEEDDENEDGSHCGLMKCSRCLQIKYCSRECQAEHWKKAHKNHCKSMTTTKSPPSSSKNS